VLKFQKLFTVMTSELLFNQHVRTVDHLSHHGQLLMAQDRSMYPMLMCCHCSDLLLLDWSFLFSLWLWFFSV